MQEVQKAEQVVRTREGTRARNGDGEEHDDNGGGVDDIRRHLQFSPPARVARAGAAPLAPAAPAGPVRAPPAPAAPAANEMPFMERIWTLLNTIVSLYCAHFGLVTSALLFLHMRMPKTRDVCVRTDYTVMIIHRCITGE